MGTILNGSGLSQVSEGGSEARPTPHMNAPFGGWVPEPNVALFTVSILGTTMTSDSLALVP
jgi:hypothetical protein